jgi:hypothetical protein
MDRYARLRILSCVRVHKRYTALPRPALLAMRPSEASYAKIRRQDRRMQLPALYMPLTFWRDGYPCVQIGFPCYVPLIHAVPR